MSQRNGDRSLFNRKRKAKIARRLRWRDVAAQSATPAPSAKPSTAKARVAKS